jgi:ABC-type transporter Mla subunit MlaD
MPEDTFRIVVAAGVALAALAFVVQAAILLAIYRTSRKMQQRTSQFIEEVAPVMQRVGPTLDRAGQAIDKIGPAVERIGPMLDKAGPAFERIGPMADKIGVFAERASAVASTTNRLIDENRPRIAQISSEAASLVRTGREQAEHFGEILHDAGDLARDRLERIDKAVDSTVEQVEQVSGAVKRAVMRPVKEVNGIAAGISAAVSALVRGQRKSSVDEATQDEEMFI